MRPFVSHFAVCALALAAVLSGYNQSRAGLMPVSSTVTPSGSNFTYSYGLSLTANATLQAGNYFTIYDFQGLVPNSNTQPTGFAFSSTLVGPTPAGTTPVDSPTISNVTWTYTGLGAPVGPASLGNFTVQSQFGTTTTGSFASLAQLLVGDQAVNSVTQSTVTVPGGQNCTTPVGTLGDPSGAPSVPEPASLALLCIGAPLLGLFCFQCKRSSKRIVE